jgi:hypothetical protein
MDGGFAFVLEKLYTHAGFWINPNCHALGYEHTLLILLQSYSLKMGLWKIELMLHDHFIYANSWWLNCKSSMPCHLFITTTSSGSFANYIGSLKIINSCASTKT